MEAQKEYVKTKFYGTNQKLSSKKIKCKKYHNLHHGSKWPLKYQLEKIYINLLFYFWKNN